MSLLARLRRSPTDQLRSRRFRGRSHSRYWWHQIPDADFVPAIYAGLTDDEWTLLDQWFEETARRQMTGEINVPAMSLVRGLVDGGAVTRFVQVGHYCGYSALLIGFQLRRMGGSRRLVSIDIDPVASDFAQAWIERAGLTRQVALVTGDSTDPALQARVLDLVGGAPQLMLVDGSHAYATTIRELDLWMPAMAEQGIVLLHGTSVFAQGFDPSGEGGVARAVDDWVADRTDVAYLNLNRHVGADGDPSRLTYRDGCGIGLLQRLPGAR